MNFRISIVVLTLFGLTSGTPARPATCDVPSAAHPTIQSAVDDAACSEVALAAGLYDESPVIERTLSLVGAGSDLSFVLGPIEVSAGVVQLTGLRLSVDGEALVAHGGAEVTGFDVLAAPGVPEQTLFADGFESGDASAWSVSFP